MALYSEIMRVKPVLDSTSARKMENDLNRRFQNVAKKFGRGLTNIVKGGGILGFAMVLADKFLNPLKATQDAIEAALKVGDDLVTNARQFGTTAGTLQNLRTIAESTGLAEQDLYQMLSRFQVQLAEARQDPSKPSVLQQFTDISDTGIAFSTFIQSLQKATADVRAIASKQVFGDERVLKAAEFTQVDFAKQKEILGLRPGSDITPQIERLAGLSDRLQVGRARQNYNDTLKKSYTIESGMVREILKGEQVAKDRENANIQGFENLKNIQAATDKIGQAVDQGLLLIGKLVPKIESLVETVNKFRQGGVKGAFKSIFGSDE